MCTSQAISVLLPNFIDGVTLIMFGPLAIYYVYKIYSQLHNAILPSRTIINKDLTIFFINKGYTVSIGFKPVYRLQHSYDQFKNVLI